VRALTRRVGWGNTQSRLVGVQYRFVDGYGADDHHAHFRAGAAAVRGHREGVPRRAANFSLVWEVAPPDDDLCTTPSAVVLYRRHGGLPSPACALHTRAPTRRVRHRGGLEYVELGDDLSCRITTPVPLTRFPCMRAWRREAPPAPSCPVSIAWTQRVLTGVKSPPPSFAASRWRASPSTSVHRATRRRCRCAPAWQLLSRGAEARHAACG
jgi:hypothetical protein